MSKKDAQNGATIAIGVASLFAGPGGALAAYANIIRGAQVALTLYGIYNGYRQSQKSANAYNAGLEDRVASVASVDSPRSVVYGRRVVKGRPVFWVEPKNGTKVNEPNYYFWMVYALEPCHEIDAIEEIYFNGEPAGPFNHPLHAGMTDVALGSKFYRSTPKSDKVVGVVGAGGQYTLPTAIGTILLSVTVIDPATMDNGDTEGSWMTGRNGTPVIVQATLSGSVVTVPAKYAGWQIIVHYQFDAGGPYLTAMGYLGTETQTVNKEVQQADPVWNNNCRLLGTPYVVVRIDPDVDMYQSGVPVITALIRGKKVYDPWSGATAWSANPALHIYDYLTRYCEILPTEISLPHLLAVRNASNELLRIPDDRETKEANYEPRFECHSILSTENGGVDNFRVLLGSIGGTSTFTDGQYQVRAAIRELPSGPPMTQDMLGNGNIVTQPRPSVFENFNSVRGVFVNAAERYITADYPPYQSEYYVALNRGHVLPQQIDFAAVTSPHQAQRIARIQLHLARNTLTFEATWTIGALIYSPGQVVTVTLSQFGWDAKPFRIQKREFQADGQVKMIMREEASTIYGWTYQEGKEPDPSPNTNLPSPYDIAKVMGLSIESGARFTEFESGGQVKPSARIKWDLHTTQTVIYGGNIEVWYRWESWDEWEKRRLPGTATRLDIPIRYNRTVIVQVRGVNALGIPGPWTIKSHAAVGAPTSAIAGQNLLYNPLMQGWEFADATPPWRSVTIPGWRSPNNLLGGEKAVTPYFTTPGQGGPYAGGGTYFKVDAPAAGEINEVWSDPVPLIAGTERLLAFADVNLMNCDGSVAIRFSGSGGQHISTYRGEWLPWWRADYNTPPYFERVFVFARVPEGATAAAILIGSRARTAGQVAQLFFRTPQLSIASPNQLTLPDWTP